MMQGIHITMTRGGVIVGFYIWGQTPSTRTRHEDVDSRSYILKRLLNIDVDERYTSLIYA